MKEAFEESGLGIPVSLSWQSSHEMMNIWYEVVISENEVEIRALGEIWGVSCRHGSLGCLEQS